MILLGIWLVMAASNHPVLLEKLGLKKSLVAQEGTASGDALGESILATGVEDDMVELCTISPDATFGDYGAFWTECFPEWTEVHAWSCEWLHWGDWDATEDAVGCYDGLFFPFPCDHENYVNASIVCETMGGEWTCLNKPFHHEFHCERPVY